MLSDVSREKRFEGIEKPNRLYGGGNTAYIHHPKPPNEALYLSALEVEEHPFPGGSLDQSSGSA